MVNVYGYTPFESAIACKVSQHVLYALGTCTCIHVITYVEEPLVNGLLELLIHVHVHAHGSQGDLYK